MIYLDASATTPVDPRVVEAMLPFLTRQFANPSASYAAARLVKKALDTAREQVAALVDAEPDEIIFTSGGTESDNAAIGSAITMEPRRGHFVTVKTEHSAVLETARRWMEYGRPVSEVGVDRGGRVRLDDLRGAMQAGQTALVSVMWANNETGVIAPIEDVAQIAHERGVLFHTDAVQAIGKLRVSVKQMPVDYLSLSGHKFHAPKGVGALFISRRARFKPWALGGGQEFGRRSGTEAIPNIVALGMAAEIARGEIDGGVGARLGAMRDAFEQRLLAALPGVTVNGDRDHRLPAISNLCFPGVDAAGLIILLDEREVACSAGSACHAGDLQSSHVLTAMGRDDACIRGTMRFSWSRMNTMEETLRAADVVIDSVNKLRSLRGDGSPVIASS